MGSPVGRREAMGVLTSRGISQRKACSYLTFSRGWRATSPSSRRRRLCLMRSSTELPDRGRMKNDIEDSKEAGGVSCCDRP